MPRHLTLDYDTHDTACEAFAWEIPDDYNAPYDLLRKHDDPKGQVAHAPSDLGVECGADGPGSEHTVGDPAAATGVCTRGTLRG